MTRLSAVLIFILLLAAPMLNAQAPSQPSGTSPAPTQAASPAANAKPAQPRIAMESNEALFAVMASINACGYDQDLAGSHPVREKIREEVVQAARTPEAQQELKAMCTFYADHLQADSAKQLAQYVSLALNMGPASDFALKLPESDLPPDAHYVQGFADLVQKFYNSASLGKIWTRYHPVYEQLVAANSGPVHDVLTSTDLYLKRPLSTYSKGSFIVYLEPMAAPALVNSRIYGDDYFMVISPTPKGIRLDQVRHAYLHFVLDPLAQTRGLTMQKLAPILKSVEDAPLETPYKKDVSLLVTESLIRAVEARLQGTRKSPEEPRRQMVDTAMKEGFILTEYFYNALVKFEAEPQSLETTYGIWLREIEPGAIQKRARNIQFAQTATPELVKKSERRPMLDLAERALAAGNLEGAEKFAVEALNRGEDAGHALFVLARASTMQGKMDEAQDYFQRTLAVSKNPKIAAWAHIYLGRIYDMKQDRNAAVEHYQAALNADPAAGTRAAAERGLKQPYTPPAQPAATEQPAASGKPE
ncbi:MAG TPA: tetratricopeptide repeat protein [candidate division Zixibacteria bacterium]|nr:tetratricopeptide repeat protein [candidate division Zixibacteria bacterium]